MLHKIVVSAQKDVKSFAVGIPRTSSRVAIGLLLKLLRIVCQYVELRQQCCSSNDVLEAILMEPVSRSCWSTFGSGGEAVDFHDTIDEKH